MSSDNDAPELVNANFAGHVGASLIAHGGTFRFFARLSIVAVKTAHDQPALPFTRCLPEAVVHDGRDVNPDTCRLV